MQARPLFAQLRQDEEDEREHQAQKDRGAEREVDAGVASAPGEVAGKAAEGESGFSGQERDDADGRDGEAEKDEDPAEMLHRLQVTGAEYGARTAGEQPRRAGLILCDLAGGRDVKIDTATKTQLRWAVRRREGVWWTFAAASAVLTTAAVLYMNELNTRAELGLRVFGSFWASGWAASHHQNPYAIYPLTWMIQLPGRPGTIADLNLSPPALLPFFSALAWFSPNTGVKVWTLVSLALFLGSGALLVHTYREHVQHRQILWFVLARAAMNMLGLGQDYSIFIALAAGAWVLLERDRQWMAGILLGLLIAAKPNYALWAVLLLFCGRWRATVVAALLAGALCALPLALYGPGIYGEWTRAVATDPHWFFPNEVSLTGFATRMGHPRIGEGLAAALLAVACGLVAWKRPSLRNTSGIALSVGMLASPLAWFHYALLIAGPLFARRWDLVLSLFLLLLMLPFAGFWYLLPVCYVAGYFLWGAAREERPA